MINKNYLIGASALFIVSSLASGILYFLSPKIPLVDEENAKFLSKMILASSAVLIVVIILTGFFFTKRKVKKELKAWEDDLTTSARS